MLALRREIESFALARKGGRRTGPRRCDADVLTLPAPAVEVLAGADFFGEAEDYSPPGSEKRTLTTLQTSAQVPWLRRAGHQDQRSRRALQGARAAADVAPGPDEAVLP